MSAIAEVIASSVPTKHLESWMKWEFPSPVKLLKRPDGQYQVVVEFVVVFEGSKEEAWKQYEEFVEKHKKQKEKDDAS